MDRKHTKYFATGIIPDGYFGDFKKVDFLFHIPTGKTIVDWHGGLFTYHTPVADDIHEAAWLLKNHPLSNAKFVTISI